MCVSKGAEDEDDDGGGVSLSAEGLFMLIHLSMRMVVTL
jgi:hypothetical protein